MPEINHSSIPVGYHYFPDSEHYSRQDLDRWLPVLASLKASFLTLLAPANRAIPEFFLRAVQEQKIEPILHLHIPLGQPSIQSGLESLMRAYAQWGIRYLVLFDRPNIRSAWPRSGWNHASLTSHFLDHFVPLAEKVIQLGLVPVFPPLEPGGDYWDTTFLRSALLGIVRRGKDSLLEKIALGSYGYVRETNWNWGNGGPDRWPVHRPYSTPVGSEDHRGFFIHQWYAAIADAVTGIRIPIIQLRAGRLSKPLVNFASRKDIGDFYRVFKGLVTTVNPDQKYLTQSGSLLVNCFWLLSAEKSSRFFPAALFSPDGQASLSAELLLRLVHGEKRQTSYSGTISHPGEQNLRLSAFPLPIYVLLPKSSENISHTWLSEIFSLFPGKNIPTGYSPLDASLARKVFLTGKPSEYPDTQLQYIHKAGCEVITCSDSGIELAQTLAVI